MTQDELKSRLHYDPETGVFTWLDNPSSPLRWRNRYPGTAAGSKVKAGYTLIRINKQQFLAHRLAFLYVRGRWPQSVDHIDGNPANNKLSNLREVDQKENMRNICMNSRNTSGRMGVAWDSSREKWAAWVNYNGRQVERKRFSNREDAEAHRDNLERKYGYHENHGRK